MGLFAGSDQGGSSHIYTLRVCLDPAFTVPSLRTSGREPLKPPNISPLQSRHQLVGLRLPCSPCTCARIAASWYQGLLFPNYRRCAWGLTWRCPNTPGTASSRKRKLLFTYSERTLRQSQHTGKPQWFVIRSTSWLSDRVPGTSSVKVAGVQRPFCHTITTTLKTSVSSQKASFWLCDQPAST